MSDTMPIRPAATVVLLRDGADGLEVWLQQRATTLAFAAGMYAFPVGASTTTRTPRPSPTTSLVKRTSGVTSTWTVVRAHLAAAVRETWEESGVRLDPAVAGAVGPLGDAAR